MENGVHSATYEQLERDVIKLNELILNCLKESTKNDNIKFPENILLEKSVNGIKILLSMEAVGMGNGESLNMQKDAAAFEGWAAVIYTYFLKPLNDKDSETRKIILGTQKSLDEEPNFNQLQGHYPRFLYRAMKFSEEYDWIILDENLKKVVKNFEKWFKNEKLVNNYPQKAKGSGKSDSLENPTTENEVENHFIQDDKAKTKLLELANMDAKGLNRQLPVGLFKGNIAVKNSVFTRGKSAIDLWAVDEKNIAIFELKTNNRMIGIITELFFYSEYVYDVFISQNNIECSKIKIEERGYNLLITDDTVTKKIHSFFLTNGLHPLISKEVIDVLNKSNNGKIQYGNIEYDLSLKIL